MFKASTEESTGAGSAKADLPFMPNAHSLATTQAIELNYHYDDFNPVMGSSYKVTLSSGQVLTGSRHLQGILLPLSVRSHQRSK